MTHKRPSASQVDPPVVGRPAPFVERRVAPRREADRLARRETVLLARSLDILAGGDDAEHRLAGILDLLARTAGARRAAIVADGTGRRARRSRPARPPRPATPTIRSGPSCRSAACPASHWDSRSTTRPPRPGSRSSFRRRWPGTLPWRWLSSPGS
jgi:hypothetical protein